MRALFDVNFLVALLDPGHLHHAVASQWHVEHVDQGWASCPITQNGFIRVTSSQSSGTASCTPAEAAFLLRGLIDLGNHEFWADSLSLLDVSRIHSFICHGPRQITDVYLLGLAVQYRGRLVTFDKSIDSSFVLGADPENIVVLAS